MMSDDPQDAAENLDTERIDDADDRTGDEVGENLPGYPPDRPLGTNTVGVTPVEEDAGESLAERTTREEPETNAPAEAERDVGQIVDPAAMSEDREAELIAEALPATE